MLVPSRTGGKRPLDMHRVCGLISGGGQGDRKKGLKGVRLEQAATGKCLAVRAGVPGPALGITPLRAQHASCKAGVILPL